MNFDLGMERGYAVHNVWKGRGWFDGMEFGYGTRSNKMACTVLCVARTASRSSGCLPWAAPRLSALLTQQFRQTSGTAGKDEPSTERRGEGDAELFPLRPHPTVDRVIRINHAGEFGADRIYAGQAAVLGSSSVGPLIKVAASHSVL